MKSNDGHRISNRRHGLPFLIIIIFGSGAASGLVYGTVSVALVGPYLDAATEIENQSMFESGEERDTAEFRAEYELYREWQRGGHVAAGVVFGVAMGSLFGIVFAASEGSLPGRGPLTKAVLLAGVMWVALYVIPFIKYPPNPPATGDPDTIALRTVLYLALVAASGLGALCIAKMSLYAARKRRVAPGRAAIVGVASYTVFAAALMMLMPSSPDPDPAIDSQLLSGFRAMSAVGAVSFWASVGVILGLFWRLRLGGMLDGRGSRAESQF